MIGIILIVVLAVGLYFLLKKKKQVIVTYKDVSESYDNGGIRRSFRVKVTKQMPDDIVISEVVDGEETFYYPSGKLNRRNVWKDGLLAGPFTVYYEDGKTYIEGEYNKGTFCGSYNVYDKNNQIIWSKKY